MKLHHTLTAAVLALAAGTSLASAASPGIQQMANQAHVSADAYTPAEIARLIEAQREGDAETVRAILNHAITDGSNTVGSAANAQFEGLLGVEPGRYTTAELVALERAQLDNDPRAAAYILTGANRAAPADASAVTPGEAQIAARLGVNPADYTLNELGAMLRAAED